MESNIETISLATIPSYISYKLWDVIIVHDMLRVYTRVVDTRHTGVMELQSLDFHTISAWSYRVISIYEVIILIKQNTAFLPYTTFSFKESNNIRTFSFKVRNNMRTFSFKVSNNIRTTFNFKVSNNITMITGRK